MSSPETRANGVARYLFFGCIGAVAAVWTMNTPPESGEAQPDAHGVQMQVFTEDSTEPLAWGAPVKPGTRLSVRVASQADGYLALTGLDATGGAYAVYPQGPDAAAWPAGPSQTVETAVELDANGDRERLVALHCPEPFTTRETQISISRAKPRNAADPMRRLDKQCAQAELMLRKDLTP